MHALWQSGKVDSASVLGLRSTIDAAAVASLDALDAVNAAVASPADTALAKNAAELANESAALDMVAQRANIVLSSLPNLPILCVTNAANILSESTNTDLGNDAKARYSLKLRVIFLTNF
jgi:hypothetical protein